MNDSVAYTQMLTDSNPKCIRIDRNHTTSKTPSDQVESYAVGVGKIKETGARQNNDQTLELAAAPRQ